MTALWIDARALSCRRGNNLLWKGLDLPVAPGGAIHIIGANGTGKSSLLRMIAGLLPTLAGTITCHGAIGLVDENPALDSEKTLGQALGFWAKVDGHEDVQTALFDVGMAKYADIPIRYFSTGQRKRASLARILLQNAPIWLLDEPMNGLDTEGLSMLETLISRHRADGGCALIASHQPLTIETMLTLNLADYTA